uniref:VWFA domain-containing protein n=1 Tax=Phasianus colchicus TaxID=9054 RepID=A0A669P7J4_PHACC
MKTFMNEHNQMMRLTEAIENIDQIGGGTRTGNALSSMKTLFKMAYRDNVPQILIVITDGKSEDGVNQTARDLRQQGINIYAIGIKDAVQQELEEIAGTKNKMFFVNDFDSLKHIKLQVKSVILTYSFFFFLYFLVCKNVRADIVFLVDSSNSIRPAEFQKIKDFMQSFVIKVDVGLDNVRIGLIQFSSEIREEFQLDRYSTIADVRRAIQEIQQIKLGTLTGKALTFAASYFDPPRGGRPELKQYLIVITDGEAQDSVKNPARAIRDKGITIYAINFKASREELEEITEDQERLFFVQSYDALENIHENLTQIVCEKSQPGKDDF